MSRRWWSSGVFRRTLLAVGSYSRNPHSKSSTFERTASTFSSPLLLYRAAISQSLFKPPKFHGFCSSTASGDSNSLVSGGEGEKISFAEAKELMRLVNVEALKTKLGVEGKEVIGYDELLEACKRVGIARSLNEAVVFARVLDEAGVVLLFRNKVYLHPDKVHFSDSPVMLME